MKRSVADRAKQFAPFAALCGFEEYIDAQEHVPVPRPELAEDEIARINAALCSIGTGERVRIRVYSSGEIVSVDGEFAGIDSAFGMIRIGKRRINLSDVVGVELTTSSDCALPLTEDTK